ncbi:phosphatidylglycerol lysyltransferase domain-containing protein [Pararhizobium sp.]|uniref:phosphatidylglycerol lysyltransferase domain-containing protein n=1 Tax=Pararhizobium sp. TaxID=1977563 RepID=UPI0027267718|nr:phosphatidylglycerol lysyltransferase domain-containing protein [Pararhizobium sp.]MDO9414722.1 phosphatidylglycerol lysyltransferase domain-containing protein [Pararhizobium sp.]
MPNFRKMLDRLLDSYLPKFPPFAPDLNEKLALCQRYGDFSLAYSTAVQPDLHYFGDADGYIAYATKMGHTFVLGDPVAAPERREDYIRRFVALAGGACFVQIGTDTARVLATLGYKINQMGVDTTLPLDANSFAGKRNETVRYSEKWLLKKDYRLLECDGSVAAAEQVQAISNNWRSGRIVKRREMRFLNRPFELELAPHMRRFIVVDPGGQPVALLDFDPIFRDGTAVGYTTAFKRKLTGTTPHAEVGLTKYAADRFREEGRSHVTFGLSPLAAVEPSGYAESRIWRNCLQRAFRSKQVNARIFNLQGQAAFKRRFHGQEEPTYIAFRRGSPFKVWALLRLLKTL